MRWILILLTSTSLLACGGQQDSGAEAPNAETDKAEKPASEEKKEAKKEEKKPEKPKAEPENRKSLELLSVRGPSQAKGIRSERSGMYQEFRALKDEHKKAVSDVVNRLQYFQWSSEVEDMKAAPDKILAFIDECLEIGEKFKVDGEASHEKLTQWEKEIEEGKKRHKDKKIEDIKAKRNSEMKVYRSLNLLIRSLLDEALVYGRFGSWAMQDDMKEKYLARKDKLKADSQMANSYDTLLMVLGVPAAER